MDIPAIIQSIQEQFSGAIVEQTPGWVTLQKGSVLSVARYLKEGAAEFSSLHSLTAVDRKDTVEVVYHLFSFKHRVMLTLKAVLPNTDLAVDSLTSLWGGADWLEREVYDLFGVHFEGHPDLRRILNPESWTAYPLRKDFKMDGFIPKPVK